eukprot:GHVU01042323.1.p2 GENE.GHVU01042323.1~~GHVU01042323.1.p2  ORF type:complete len:141 (+),score=19.00 GHVU01042323.1:211-633(+)
MCVYGSVGVVAYMGVWLRVCVCVYERASENASGGENGEVLAGGWARALGSPLEGGCSRSSGAPNSDVNEEAKGSDRVEGPRIARGGGGGVCVPPTPPHPRGPLSCRKGKKADCRERGDKPELGKEGGGTRGTFSHGGLSE